MIPVRPGGAMDDVLALYRRRGQADFLADIHDDVDPILQDMIASLGCECALVAITDETTGTLRGALGVNVSEDLLELVVAPLDDPGPLAQALREGRPIRIDDVSTDSRLPDERRATYAALGMLSFVVLPLLPVLGALVVSRGQPFTDDEINDVIPFAARITAVLSEQVETRHLRESSERHAIEREWLWWMLNAVQDPIVLSDDENNILIQNDHAERLLQASPEDSPGKRRAIELNNFLLSAALSSFRLDQGAALGRELTLVDPIEGHELLYEVICRPATNLKTGERGLVSVLKDVTDLRRAAEEVQRSLAHLRAAGEQARHERDRLNLLLESVADPIVVTESSGEIILMNGPAERLFQARDEPVGRAMATTYLANDAKLSSFLSQLRLEPTRVRRGELPLIDPETDEPLLLGVTATEVRDEFGQVSAVVSVLHDLSRLRELERRRVEQQLFESEKLAAVGRLAATVAHEINNPLEAIKNALYLLVSRSAPDDPNRRFLEIANKETERVSGIIRQMLGFYRPTASKTAVDVNRVLEEVAVLLDRKLRQCQVTLHREFDEKLPPVLAAGDQLKQVFLNLFLNAQEAMPGGGAIHVTTRLSRETDTEFLAGHYVLIQVRDSGGGIPEEHLPHIFEPFYSTKTDSKGTGLGLWVTMGIIQNHGGQLKVRSRPGRGTTFTIALPPAEGS